MSGRLVYLDPHARCAHRRYKLTCDDYDDLAKKTDGRCGVCGAEPARLIVDHDHNIGRWAVRGLICRRCNALLRDVDSGRVAPTPDVVTYLKAAWFLTREEPASAVQARRPRRRDAPTMTARDGLDERSEQTGRTLHDS